MKVLKVLSFVVALLICNTTLAQFSNTSSNNTNRPNSSKNHNNYSPSRPIYKGFVEGGYTFGDWGHGCVLTSHGCQINRHIFVGVGSGVKFIDGEVFVPIYGDFRINFLKSNITPFFGAKVGYSIHEAGGFMVEPSLGCRFGFNENLGITLSAGYEYQNAEVFYYSYYYDYGFTGRENVGGFMLKLGFEF